ncbi:hypothetical protein MBEHAL_0689 [Halarchaeum acidiphilum MH1-52-1]|uniref:Uncharacterized protein n=1 Tax=Halarchaeum acidiphilum MH1-52-1 TaxID=1261545 RepID=U3A2R1_9EURY|nr:hypothetical protein MBEHAL_0689 [Halarchaeum acidiphilum MH1-52-1]
MNDRVDRYPLTLIPHADPVARIAETHPLRLGRLLRRRGTARLGRDTDRCEDD